MSPAPAPQPAPSPSSAAPAIADGNELPFSPAADRNKAPILERLSALLPARARVLEIASGTGQHAAHFAANQPGWHWQPTDVHPASRAVLARRCAGLPGVQALQTLDLLAPPAPWPAALDGPFDAVYVANLLHIAPWACCGALMALAARVLAPGGLLVIYGPFVQAGVATAPSNLAFDADLRQRDPAWGLRTLEAVTDTARQAGLKPGTSGLPAMAASGAKTADQAAPPVTTMPANNLLLVFQRAA